MAFFLSAFQWLMLAVAIVIVLTDELSLLPLYRWRNRMRRLATCSALECESEVREESAGLFPMGLRTHRPVLSMENARPQDTTLGLCKKVMRTSRLKSFRTLSSNRSPRPSAAGHSFPGSDPVLWLFFIPLAVGIQVTRVTVQKDETW